mgnify:FL=1
MKVALGLGQLASVLEVLLYRTGHLEGLFPLPLVAFLLQGAFHAQEEHLCLPQRPYPWCQAFLYPEGFLSSAKARRSEWFCLKLLQPEAFRQIAAPPSAISCHLLRP